MEAFILEFKGKKVTINCGSNEIFTGIVEECMNNVLTLKQPNGNIYININKIVSMRQSELK